MSRLSRVEELAIAHYVDGKMSQAERDAFERRVSDKPHLQAGLTAALDRSRLLRSVGEPVMRPPGRFAASVMEEVRNLPPRVELVRITQDETLMGDALRHARRLLAAAVLLFSVSNLFTLDLLGPPDSGQLSASDVQEEMDQLDEQVRALKKERRNR